MEGRWYCGRVVNNNDPLMLKRVQIRARDIHRQIPDADLPWALPKGDSPNGQNGVIGSINIPVKGSKVWFQLMDNSLDYPRYDGDMTTEDMLVAELNVGYPNSRGHIDLHGNKLFIDDQNNTTFTHQTGTIIHIDGSTGDTTVNSARDLNHYAQRDVNITAKRNVNISGDSINFFCNNMSYDIVFNFTCTAGEASLGMVGGLFTIYSQNNNVLVGGQNTFIMSNGGSTNISADGGLVTLGSNVGNNVTSVGPIYTGGAYVATPIIPPSPPSNPISPPITVARSVPVSTPFTGQLDY